MKLMILGHGRHGKDTVAEYIRDEFGFACTSSSLTAAKMIFPKLAGKYGYATVEECFADRHNHRAEWYDLILAYNSPDKASLARLIYQTNDIYVGMRSWQELAACRNAGLFDAAIWVDRRDRCPPEAADSMTIEPWMADYIIDNNGSLEELNFNIIQLMHTLYEKDRMKCNIQNYFEVAR